MAAVQLSGDARSTVIDRRVIVLLARARETGAHVTIPATVLTQVVRAPARQVRLARLVRQPTEVVPLGRIDATSVGRLLAASGTADIVDAHVFPPEVEAAFAGKDQ